MNKLGFLEFFHSKEDADHFDYSFDTYVANRNMLHLIPGEIYTQFSKIYTAALITNFNARLISKENKEIDFDFGAKIVDRGHYQEINYSFRINENLETDCLRIHLETNIGTLYTNVFVCDSYNKDLTTLVSYRHEVNDYLMPYSEWPTIYQQIRLPLYYHHVTTEEDSEEYTVKRAETSNVRQSRVVRRFFEVFNVWAGTFINKRLAIVSDNDLVYFKNIRTKRIIDNPQNKEKSIRYYTRPYEYDTVSETEELNESELEAQPDVLDFLETDHFLPVYLDATLSATENVNGCEKTGVITANFEGQTPINGIVKMRFSVLGTLTVEGSEVSDGQIVEYEYDDPTLLNYTLTSEIGSSASVLIELLDKDGNILTNSINITHSCGVAPEVLSVVSGVGCCLNQGTGIEIGEAECETDVNTIIWDNVFVESTPIGVGSIIYTDSALTIPFDGQNLNYKYRISNGLTSVGVYKVDSNGVVISVNSCFGNNGEPILENSPDGCERRYMGTFVAQPTDQVRITFNAVGSAYGVTINGSTTLSSDGQTTTVTGSASYDTGFMPNVLPTRTQSISFENLTTGETAGAYDISAENTTEPC